jgi:hypothetical protein
MGWGLVQPIQYMGHFGVLKGQTSPDWLVPITLVPGRSWPFLSTTVPCIQPCFKDYFLHPDLGEIAKSPPLLVGRGDLARNHKFLAKYVKSNPSQEKKYIFHVYQNMCRVELE